LKVLPPKGCNPWKTLEAIRLLKTAGVDGVNIPDGPRAQNTHGSDGYRRDGGTRIGMESVLHYCCRDRNLLGMIVGPAGRAALACAISY